MTDPNDAQSFDCHRGIVPTLSVFAALAVAELLLTHLVVSLVWPRGVWAISAITLVGLVWLVAWMRSFRRCPHVLAGGELRLRMGTLKAANVPISDIAAIDPVTSLAAAKAPGVRRLVPLVMPNRLVVLRAPLADSRKTSAYAVRLDDPAVFDRALSAAIAPA